MTIEELGKMASELHRRLPEFVDRHPKGFGLAACRNLMARCNGFPNWRGAVAAAAQEEAAPIPSRGIGPHVAVRVERKAVQEFSRSGNERPLREHDCLRFDFSAIKGLDRAVSQLDHFLVTQGSSQKFVDGLPPANRRTLAELCRRLVASVPGYIDGHAHLTGALVRLGQHAAAIDYAEPIFAELGALFPPGFKGRVAYNELDNRPFHRLAYSLLLAYYGRGTPEANHKGSALANQMVSWWPNDNLGFRFLLTPKAYAAATDN